VFLGVRLGLSSLILAHTVFAIPIAYLPIRARLEGLDPSLAEAAADLYATPWQSLRRVILPLIWPGILSGVMLAFIGSLGDVVISYFVSGPGSTTLPVYIFSMVRMGVTPTVNAVSAILIAASISLLSLSYLLGRRFR
jgi:spermidine/putrescine transport system permease protein